MTPEEAEAVAHRWHLEVVQAGNLALLDDILTPDFVAHVNDQDIGGVDGAKQMATALRTAVPDAQITHHEAVVAGDRVVIRWTSAGTHQGEYLGVPPSGKRVQGQGLDLFHLRDGKIAEVWIMFDNLSLLQQMGAIPTQGQGQG